MVTVYMMHIPQVTIVNSVTLASQETPLMARCVKVSCLTCRLGGVCYMEWYVVMYVECDCNGFGVACHNQTGVCTCDDYGVSGNYCTKFVSC